MRFFFLSILLIAGISAKAQFSLKGKIYSSDDQNPVPGAVIRLAELGTAVTSDDDGMYILNDIPEGDYRLEVSHISFTNKIFQIEVEGNTTMNFELSPSTIMAEEVIVRSTRANKSLPLTYSEMNKEDIKQQNQGQDLPVILNYLPSVVSTSDAGAGIGYTGIRIRGTDPTRINVTINGVPLNDSESQGVFWVNIPDIASSTQSVQVQRGVGTSTNGAGAFGATINLQTNHLEREGYAEFVNGIGSFNTRRHTFNFGTGLIKDHWAVDGRISRINSDGYIDRAESDLDSYYFSAGYYGKNTIVKGIIFGGDERTYQSWYGTPQAVLENDPEGIEEVIINNGLDDEQAQNIRTAGRTFNWYLYPDQVDDYQQDHTQLHASHRFSEKFTAQLTFHYTYGSGFFEQYERDADFDAYGLQDINFGDSTLQSTDLVQRRWLDNHFYGTTFSFNYLPANRTEIILGGGWNLYDGDHFGQVIWAENALGNIPKDYKYYDNVGRKRDLNTYLKVDHKFTSGWSIFVDLQYRGISYSVEGVDNDQRPLDISADYNFFNPKAGFSYSFDNNSSVYASYAVANREPVRTDFIDNDEVPRPERLNNFEAGYRMQAGSVAFEANAYYMDYKDQLVLTGELNDVGSALRRNVGSSFRAGIELQAAWQLMPGLNWQANVTFSRNKIDEFQEVIYDYGPAFDEFNVIVNTYRDTDIAYSPEVIAGSQLNYTVFEGGIVEGDVFQVSLFSKYVGDQFLDNTSNAERKIDAYFVNDLQVRYGIENWVFDAIDLTLRVNNIFAERYSSHGYTFGYQAGPDYVVRENYFYPQALTNYLLTLGIRI
jgi:iron complex outermembrane receptor protein